MVHEFVIQFAEPEFGNCSAFFCLFAPLPYKLAANLRAASVSGEEQLAATGGDQEIARISGTKWDTKTVQ